MDALKSRERLRHMLDAAEALQRLAARTDAETYRNDPDLAAAVERYLERLSEASRHIPQALKAGHPHIDWRGVADIGNVLRHSYDQISEQRILRTLHNDIPILKVALEAMIATLSRPTI